MNVIGLAPNFVIGPPPGEETATQEALAEKLANPALDDPSSTSPMTDESDAENEQRTSADRIGRIAHFVVASQKRKRALAKMDPRSHKTSRGLAAYGRVLEAGDPSTTRGAFLDRIL